MAAQSFFGVQFTATPRSARGWLHSGGELLICVPPSYCFFSMTFCFVSDVATVDVFSCFLLYVLTFLVCLFCCVLRICLRLPVTHTYACICCFCAPAHIRP